MLGFLKTRGPVKDEKGINRTKAINIALLDKKLKVESFNMNGNKTYFGIVPTINHIGQESFDYYFTCSDDFLKIEYVHIYDYGEGGEEEVLEINDDFKLLIIGKCLLYNYSI